MWLSKVIGCLEFFSDGWVDNSRQLNLLEDYSGFVREKAIKAVPVKNKSDVLVLRKLLIRANDWVPQVRVAANSKIVENGSMSPEYILEVLPSVYHLKNCSRQVTVLLNIFTILCKDKFEKLDLQHALLNWKYNKRYINGPNESLAKTIYDWISNNSRLYPNIDKIITDPLL